LNKFQERLRTLSPAGLKGIRRGIEKESLRVRPEGSLALTSHPLALGSALTHPHITTDFSESQLELITGVHAGVESCLEELTRIHQVAYRALGDEMMWCASMPCGLPADDVIPIGRYGRSNVGRMKTVYRTGLSHRYGRRMQMISGIHYNFSLPDSVWPIPDFGEPNEAYFALTTWRTMARRYSTPSPGPIHPTRRSASATATITASSRPACCRSRTSSTARSARNASSGRASGRCTHCASAASSTSRYA